MEIKLKKEDFLKSLYMAQNIADRKSTMPVLANVLIKSEGKETILCAATDLRISVIAETKAEIFKEGGISIVAKQLFDIIKNMPGEEITFKKAQNNWAEIVSGKAHYQIVGMSERDFPRLPEHQDIEFLEVDARAIKEMIDKTIFSISADESRRHLSGVLLEWLGKNVKMVSTDGHRLSKVEMELGKEMSIEEGIIIPRKGLQEIRRLVENIEGTCDLGLKEGNLVVRENNIILFIKLIDAKFPPYKQVIPISSEKKIVLNRIILLDSIKRISIINSEKNGGIKIELSPGRLRIISDNPDIGEAHEDLDVEYQGENLNIGFNARYFIDLLNEMDDEEVILELNGQLDPGMIRQKKTENYIGVIMPMRL